MKILLSFLSAISVCLSAATSDPGTRIFLIGGWRTEDASFEESIESLHRIFPEVKHIDRLKWPANGEYPTVRERADQKAKEFAAEIERYPIDFRKNIILVGHSLGGRMAIRIMAILGKKKIQIKKGIFLGAAIDHDDPDIPFALRASAEQSILVYQPDDHILRDLYPDDKEIALGSRGYLGKYEKSALRQIQIKEDPSLKGHDLIFYLEHLQKKINAEADEAPCPEIHGFRHELPDPEKNVPVGQEMDSEYHGWKILKRPMPIFGKKYILCDPEMRVRAEGSLTEMRESLDDIKKILGSENAGEGK